MNFLPGHGGITFSWLDQPKQIHVLELFNILEISQAVSNAHSYLATTEDFKLVSNFNIHMYHLWIL